MTRRNKSKKGFTLLEVMLAVAIMAMCAGIFFSLILVVVKSHTNVVAANDMEDYAILNARAFENSIINCQKVNVSGSGSKTIKIFKNKLVKNNIPLFNLQQYDIVPSGDKWKVEFQCKVNANGVVEYKFTLTDRAGSMQGINNYTYVYENTVYVPHCKEINATSGWVSEISVVDY
ncbi:MAG: type II secretion system GspH family protein [Clostridia bacterium]|nr:type II secretion system GspH family protein [Clostridia bacterium]